jgi:hypothetical protein
LVERIKPERIEQGHAFRLSVVLQVLAKVRPPAVPKFMGGQSRQPNLVASCKRGA